MILPLEDEGKHLGIRRLVDRDSGTTSRDCALT
jgi:hypothetical protein